MKFWGHSSYPDLRKISQKAFLTQHKKNMLISLLENRKQKPADWWSEIIKDHQGEWTAHQQCEKMPWWSGSLFHSPWTREEAVQCGHLWLLRPVSLRGVLHGKLIKEQEAKEEREHTGTTQGEETGTQGCSQRTDICVGLQAAWWGIRKRVDGKERISEAQPLPPPSPAGPGKNKHKVALSIPSVLGLISVFLWDYRHGHSSHTWPLEMLCLLSRAKTHLKEIQFLKYLRIKRITTHQILPPGVRETTSRKGEMPPWCRGRGDVKRYG